jgi:hypothetical protein
MKLKKRFATSRARARGARRQQEAATHHRRRQVQLPIPELKVIVEHKWNLRAVEGAEHLCETLVDRHERLVVVGVKEGGLLVRSKDAGRHHGRTAQIEVADRILGRLTQKIFKPTMVPRRGRRSWWGRRLWWWHVLLCDQMPLYKSTHAPR